MKILLDNIFAFIVLMLILSVSMTMLISSSYNSLAQTGEHQLEEVSASIVQKTVFDAGYAPDWGKDVQIGQEDLTVFGLHKVDGDVYELDINKVLKLVNGTIDPKTVSGLLGLGGETRYRFSMEIMPFLNISAEVTGYHLNIPSAFSITVENYAKRISPNCKLIALYSIIWIKEGQVFFRYTNASTITNWAGEASLNMTPWLESIRTELEGNEAILPYLVLSGNYFQIKGISHFSFGQTTPIRTVGDYLFFSSAEEASERAIVCAPPYYIFSERVDKLDNQTLKIQDGIEDSICSMIVPFNSNGTYQFALASRLPINLLFQSGLPSTKKTSVISRMVKMGDYDYLFKLIVWREVEA